MVKETPLWKALRTGELSAFTDVYKAYYQFLFSYAYRHCGDKNLSKDCIHELFLELWKNRMSLPEVQHIGYYLRSILQRKLVRELRKNSSIIPENEFEEREGGVFQSSYEELVVQLQSKEEMKEKVRRALLQLTPRQLVIIRMKFFEDKTYDEIAATTSVTPRTIYNQVYMALKTLREHLRIFFFV